MILTFDDFSKRFPNDDACLDALFTIKFGNLGKCPACHKATKFHRIKLRKAYECQWCGKQLSPMQGTIFQKSPTPLKKWFHAMYLLTTTRSGVSAKELERQLGVSYKCAWRIASQLRTLMGKSTKAKKLSGHVELDETYVGGKGGHNKRRRGAEHKTPVFGMLQRGGSVIAKPVENVKSATLIPLVLDNVRKGIRISTDEFRSYNGLKKLGFEHGRVHHAAKQYANGDISTNSLEGFWSQVKRSISGTHVWVSKKHLQKYIDEFAFRYNNRKIPSEMFDLMLQNA